jgi:hypothetical protein
MTRPATSGSFKKGDPRINRKGRPKIGKTISEKFRNGMEEVLDEATGYSSLDSIIDAIIRKALKGNQDAAEYALARGYGKLIDRVEQINLNKNYDFSNLSPEERLKLLELMERAKPVADVPSDNSDTE